MKKLVLAACLSAVLPMPAFAGNLSETCTAFDLEEGARLEAFCLERTPRFTRRGRYSYPEWYPLAMMRRTSIYLEHCIGEDAFGNLEFSDEGHFTSQCHSIGFNDTRQGPMLYATCRDDSGNEVQSMPLNLSDGLSSENGQLVCAFGN